MKKMFAVIAIVGFMFVASAAEAAHADCEKYYTVEHFQNAINHNQNKIIIFKCFREENFENIKIAAKDFNFTVSTAKTADTNEIIYTIKIVK